MGTRDDERRRDRAYIRAVGDRIVDWDPIGLIALGAPSDEYHCLVGPVIGGLRQGLSPDELAAALDRFIDSHFAVNATGTAEFAIKIIAWDQGQRT
jgi:hypothetical protein